VGGSLSTDGEFVDSEREPSPGELQVESILAGEPMHLTARQMVSDGDSLPVRSRSACCVAET